jgi:hypothetical protein
VLIDLQVRRFFCGNPGCAKTTFAEQVPGLTVRYGRRTCSLHRRNGPVPCAAPPENSSGEAAAFPEALDNSNKEESLCAAARIIAAAADAAPRETFGVRSERSVGQGRLAGQSLPGWQ